VKIARCANYDREHGVPDALDANNPVQAADLRHMHDQELLRFAQYDQANGPLDDLYVIPAAPAPSASPGAVNNFPAFSRHLRTTRYPEDFKPAIEKYDSRSDPSIWLKMYNIAARASGGNEDHMAGYPPCDGQGTTPVARQSPNRVHHLLRNSVSPLHDQLPGDLQSSWQYSPPHQSTDET
jgi:hypothetical protein